MIIDCPSCSRKLRVPDDLLGKQVKCPTCGHTFGAAATQIAETAAPSTGAPVNLQLDAPSSSTEPTQEFQAPSQPAKPAVEGTVLQPCPNCDKLIEPDAGRCPYCGEVPQDFFEEDDRPWDRHGFRGRRAAEP